MKAAESVFFTRAQNGKEAPVMMEHLNPEEIVKMPLHMQILYYLEKWGTHVKGAELLEKAG